MANKVFTGGMKLVMVLGSILGSFLAVSALLNSLIYCPLNAADALEIDKREKADSSIKAEIKEIVKEFSGKVTEIVNNQDAVNQQILTNLAVQKTDIKWIRENLAKR